MYGDGNVSTIQVVVNSIDLGLSSNGMTISVDSTATSYQWLDCNNAYQIIAGATGQSYTATANGNYAVEITDNGCTDTSACVLLTSLEINSIAGEENNILIYPNPFTLQTNITFDDVQKNTTLTVTDVLGNTIITSTITGRQAIIDLQGYAKGIYFVQITDEKKNIINKKIILQ